MKWGKNLKKLFVVFLSLFVLIGCANKNDSEQPIEDNDVQVGNEEQSGEENNDKNENENLADNESEENNNESNDGNVIDNDHLKEFEEYDILAKELDLKQYEGVIKSDNKGNRVILYQTKDGKKEYKSIFIKKKHRLKIVHFDDEDDLLYNDIIK